ncbi:MAG: NUDIX domain-containing protein [Treponema sp.]|nr:NUDIX domain-containing protein [Treponema sp.]
MGCVSIACIAYENGRFFVAHRNPSGDMGGRWEFPGGKVEEGESDEQAVVREMSEEFGVTVTVCERIGESEFTHNGKVSKLHAYRILLPYNGMKKKFILTEHSGYDWVEPDEIQKLYFVDSDMRIYPQVLSYIESLKNGK